jgi:hypothetical protein
VLARLCAAGFLTVDSDNRYRQMAAHGVPCGPAASNA